VLSITGTWKRTKTFLTEVRSEVKKVTFPSREEVLATTVVVVVTSVIFAFYLWLADIVIIKVYEGMIRVLG
jgi:preprotein translocase subunit SecE